MYIWFSLRVDFDMLIDAHNLKPPTLTSTLCVL